MRAIVGIVLILGGCIGDSGTDKPDPNEPAACALAEERATCPECSDGDAMCSFEDVEVVTGACGTCQTEHALLQQLCDEGSEATRDELEAGITCEKASCEVFYDGCGDPCEPLCMLAWDIPEEQCDLACDGPPDPPPGDCVLTGSSCQFQ